MRRSRSVETATYSAVVFAAASSDPRQFHHPTHIAATVISASKTIAHRSTTSVAIQPM